MAKKDIIVIGTSAEGLDPLIALAQGLRKQLARLAISRMPIAHNGSGAGKRLPAVAVF